MIIARLRIHADLSHGSGSSLRRFCCSWKGIRYTYSSFIYTPSRQVKRVDLSIFRRNLISHWNRVVFYNFSLVGSISGTVWKWKSNDGNLIKCGKCGKLLLVERWKKREKIVFYERRNLEPIFNRMMISDDRIYHGREAGDWAEVNPGS